MILKNRFAELVAAHERKTGRKWTYDDISSKTGVAPSTLSAYARNQVRRFDAATIEPLMAFFGVDHTEFFITEMTPEEKERLGQRVELAAV